MNSPGPTTTVSNVDDRQPSMAIVDLVARVDGVDPTELEPLYGVIDPDALDSVCGPSLGFQRLEFAYEGHTVTVEASGETLEIALEDAEVPHGDAAGTTDTESSS